MSYAETTDVCIHSCLLQSLDCLLSCNSSVVAVVVLHELRLGDGGCQGCVLGETGSRL